MEGCNDPRPFLTVIVLKSFYVSATEAVYTVPLHQIIRYIDSTKPSTVMIKRIIAVETKTYPPPNLTGVSTELNLSSMVPPFRHLRRNEALS